MSAITTHVLDTARGVPAAGIDVELAVREGDGWRVAGRGTTNDDGRVAELLDEPLASATYRLTFATGPYLAASGVDAPFFPEVRVEFAIDASAARTHYHVPLLLSPYGYSTYRGS